MCLHMTDLKNLRLSCYIRELRPHSCTFGARLSYYTHKTYYVMCITRHITQTYYIDLHTTPRHILHRCVYYEVCVTVTYHMGVYVTMCIVDVYITQMCIVHVCIIQMCVLCVCIIQMCMLPSHIVYMFMLRCVQQMFILHRCITSHHDGNLKAGLGFRVQG